MLFDPSLTRAVTGISHIRDLTTFDSDLADLPRWNTWTRVSPVQFAGEERPIPRAVRLCCAAARVGDPVQILEGNRMTEGRITRVAHSILHVAELSADFDSV